MALKKKLRVVEQGAEVLTAVQVEDFSHSHVSSADSQQLIQEFKQSISAFIVVDDAYVNSSCRDSAARMAAFCNAMHSVDNVHTLIAKQSPIQLMESCSHLLGRLSMLETARNLTRRFI